MPAPRLRWSSLLLLAAAALLGAGPLAGCAHRRERPPQHRAEAASPKPSRAGAGEPRRASASEVETFLATPKRADPDFLLVPVTGLRGSDFVVDERLAGFDEQRERGDPPSGERHALWVADVDNDAQEDLVYVDRCGGSGCYDTFLAFSPAPDGTLVAKSFSEGSKMVARLEGTPFALQDGKVVIRAFTRVPVDAKGRIVGRAEPRAFIETWRQVWLWEGSSGRLLKESKARRRA